jgi:hypothetical protein
MHQNENQKPWHNSGFSMTEQFDIQTLWENILSRNPDLVRTAYRALTPDEQESILAHLKRMAAEPGWHPEQALSAQVAINAIQSRGDDESK